MSALGDTQPVEDVVLVFRPPENPAAQIAGITPFKSLRLRLDEILDWFKDLNVDAIDLWIEGAYKFGNRIELFLSVEGKTGARITIRPYAKRVPSIIPEKHDIAPVPEKAEASPSESQNASPKPEKGASHQVTALFSPEGGIERHIVSLLDSAISSIEMAAYEITNLYIEKALTEAVKRGVKVSLVLERSKTIGAQARLHDNLLKAGTDVRLLSPPRGTMHNRYIVVDGRTVEWGSYSYTERAETANLENATFLSDSILAGQYHGDFESIFNRAKPEAGGVLLPVRRFFRHFTGKPH